MFFFVEACLVHLSSTWKPFNFYQTVNRKTEKPGIAQKKYDLRVLYGTDSFVETRKLQFA